MRTRKLAQPQSWSWLLRVKGHHSSLQSGLWEFSVLNFLNNTRRQLHFQLDPEAGHPGVISTLHQFIFLLVLFAVVLAVLSTEPTFMPEHRELLKRLDRAVLLVFAVELAARFWVAGLNPRHQGPVGLLKFVFRPATLTDIVVLVPLFFDLQDNWLTVFRIVRVLRLLFPLQRRAVAVYYLRSVVLSCCASSWSCAAAWEG